MVLYLSYIEKVEVEKFLVPQQEPQEENPDILDMMAESITHAQIYTTSPTNSHSSSSSGIKPEATPTSSLSPQQPTIVPSTPPVTPQKAKVSAQPKSQVDAILASLEGKNYSPDQVDLLKRVFSTMLVVCPSSNKKSVVQLMEIAVNSLK